MKFIIFITLLCCASCAWDSTAINTGYGRQTKLYSDDDYKYTIKTTSVEYIKNHFGLELNLSDHVYETTNGSKFNCLSIGSKLHIKEKISFFIVDVGGGFRLTEYGEMNRYLADSHLLADLSISAGVKKEFKKFNVQLFYTFQHLSVPWRNDRGVNYDMLKFGLTVPF